MATRTIPLRLNEETIARLDKIAEIFTLRISQIDTPRSQIMRLALEKGIEILEDQVLIEKPKQPKPKPKPKRK